MRTPLLLASFALVAIGFLAAAFSELGLQGDAPEPAARPAPPPPPSPVDAASVGAIDGVLMAPDGAPVAGAAVWITDPMRGWAPPRREASHALRHEGGTFVPPLLVAQVGDRVEVASGDGQLHTLEARSAAGRVRLNWPMLPGESVRHTLAASALGDLRVTCGVMGHAGTERPGRLVVLRHPYRAYTDEQGRFTIEGVPSGTWPLAAATAQGAVARVDVAVAAGATVRAALRLTSAPATAP